tara:strand:- start:1803 stop:2099 length:297 start_codon:yes stop_codon:yes gene_type:complete
LGSGPPDQTAQYANHGCLCSFTTQKTAGTTANAVSIVCRVANAAAGEAIVLAPGETLVKPLNNTQSTMFVSFLRFPARSRGDTGRASRWCAAICTRSR